ncbi:DUF3781 domain-containing protein [Flavobacterium ovatum]|uniref:DUF3781 domain-containing protein n=1 Tax=Flavobacterium ovatum TaxID=1928857 RepID=UPI00344B61EE
MSINKSEIINNISYTDLVYGRINKKLKTNLSIAEIEKTLLDIITETEERFFNKIGKNFYVTNVEKNIKITVNSHTFRIITVDQLEKKH